LIWYHYKVHTCANCNHTIYVHQLILNCRQFTSYTYSCINYIYSLLLNINSTVYIKKDGLKIHAAKFFPYKKNFAEWILPLLLLFLLSFSFFLLNLTNCVIIVEKLDKPAYVRLWIMHTKCNISIKPVFSQTHETLKPFSQ
jgi:hypothetical protein